MPKNLMGYEYFSPADGILIGAFSLLQIQATNLNGWRIFNQEWCNEEQQKDGENYLQKLMIKINSVPKLHKSLNQIC